MFADVALPEMSSWCLKSIFEVRGPAIGGRFKLSSAFLLTLHEPSVGPTELVVWLQGLGNIGHNPGPAFLQLAAESFAVQSKSATAWQIAGVVSTLGSFGECGRQPLLTKRFSKFLGGITGLIPENSTNQCADNTGHLPGNQCTRRIVEATKAKLRYFTL